ncbi:MAG: glycosyltransferase family 4 protein [Anaerolineales bacterium]|nr:glycosyltransferase family 4 protein [Anaerolineales bacterium]MCW5855414.1 glycosyltransferase family 4 protein [Anaerolineales bacterium]
MNDLVIFFTEDVSLADWAQGGMLAREVALYQHLAKLGRRIQFVTYGGPGEAEIAARIPEISVRFNARELPSGLYKRCLRWFPPRGHAFKSNQVSGSEIALAAARRAGARFVARCGYLLSFVDEQTHGVDSRQARAARQLEKHVFGAADRVVVTTQVIAERVQENYRLPEERIRVIPNYVETDRFVPQKSQENSRLRIGFVGRLAWEKNLLALLNAVAGLDVELVLVGAGPQKAELRAKADTLDIKLSLPGRMDNTDLPTLLNTCDVFILPSFYEGHPKALIEAMACGLAVIGTRVSGIAEIIQDGDNGLLAETDADSLREVIRRAAGDASLRAQLGKTAREYALRHFSLERVAAMELALLEELSGDHA